MVKRTIFGLKIIIVVLLFLLVGSNGYWRWRWRDQMRVQRVIDGDTFVLKTGDRVRLFGLDAPEANTCYALESKTALEKLVLNKIVKIDRDERDGFGRRIGVVTYFDKNVNLELIKQGWAKAETSEFEVAGRSAEQQKLGIFSGVCEFDPTCAILGNIDQSTGDKFYHLPECRSYNTVKISPERGERKFCSEDEAVGHGFVLAPDCWK